MNLKPLLASVSASAALLLGAAAHAAPFVPAFDTFGTLAGATFGGSGIPNTAVAISQSQGDLTLGLTAHQRFVGPNLANDGAGTFTAYVGNSNTPADPYATWNFGFYISGGDIGDSRFALFYDFDPGTGTDETAHGAVTFTGLQIPNPAQDSWNLGMNFLAAAVPGIAPPAGTFDPMVPGEYTFALVSYVTDQGRDVETARASIRVNVLRNGVPEPGTLALSAALGLGVLFARRRR